MDRFVCFLGAASFRLNFSSFSARFREKRAQRKVCYTCYRGQEESLLMCNQWDRTNQPIDVHWPSNCVNFPRWRLEGTMPECERRDKLRPSVWQPPLPPTTFHHIRQIVRVIILYNSIGLSVCYCLINYLLFCTIESKLLKNKIIWEHVFVKNLKHYHTLLLFLGHFFQITNCAIANVNVCSG